MEEKNEFMKRSFLGRGWSFPPTFHKDHYHAVMVSDEEDIQQSLQILFATSPGERPIQQTYGCPVKQFLFNKMDNSHISQLKDIIAKAILHFEPRVKLNDIRIDAQDYLEGVLHISLQYTIRATNTRNNIVFPYYVNEATLLSREK